MKVTVERVMSEAAIAVFYPLYVVAFDPIRTRAAARHMLTAEEFEAEMADERIEKYVVWDDNGEPVALGTLATDLSALPWISPEYFAARYPDQSARGAVYYLGYTLVHPQHAKQGAFQLMMGAIERRCGEARAVCAWDVSAYNDDGSIGRHRKAVLAAGGWIVDRVDVQSYYTASYDDRQHVGAAV
jgi:hypothetical protein